MANLATKLRRIKYILAGICFISGLILCMNDGDWFPVINLGGLFLLLITALLVEPVKR